MGVFRTPQMAVQRGGRPFSTPEATCEVQVRVQRLPLSEPFDLAFSFLFKGCEPFTVCAYARGITRMRGVWRVVARCYENNTYAPLEN